MTDDLLLSHWHDFVEYVVNPCKVKEWKSVDIGARYRRESVIAIYDYIVKSGLTPRAVDGDYCPCDPERFPNLGLWHGVCARCYRPRH
jgi:hypothetical protein